MKNLITGGAGFIGSHLAEHLLGLGEEVVVLDDLSTGSLRNLEHLSGRKGFTYHIGKVEDRGLLDKSLEGVDRVYHLAAAVGVRLIVEDPIRTIETNINATQLVLERSTALGKQVLLTSTSEVYGKGERLPFSEDADVVYGPTTQPRWSYAISKAADEFLLLASHRHKGLHGVIVRLFNTVGPRQVGRYGMVIPRFMEQALGGGPITVYGSGEQKRCFAHVLDIVGALVDLMNCERADGEVVNLGSEEEVSINELAKRVRAMANPRAEIVRIPYEEAYGKGFEDMNARRPSLKKALSLIGFRTKRDLETILRDVTEYARRKQG